MANTGSSSVSFASFDPQAELAKTERNLPHWFQPGSATFITFRTADSMPREVVAKWQQGLRAWLVMNKCDPAIAERPGREAGLPPELRRAYLRMSRQGWFERLDDCHGKCELREQRIAKIVGDSLLHFNGERYDLDSFVVMPNHVHLLVQFRLPTTLVEQTSSWLRFTARKINEQLHRRGKFWQSEPFDHLVRSAEQFAYLRQYIAQNPGKARLNDGEFLYWSRSQ